MNTVEAAPETRKISIETAIKATGRRDFLGLTAADAIKYFFRGNATLSIVVLFLIVVFLFREGFGFFGQNQDNLAVYRLAGLEYVDFVRQQVDDHRALGRYLESIRTILEKKHPEDTASLQTMDSMMERFSTAIDPQQELLSEWTEIAAGIKERHKVNGDLKIQQSQLIQAGKTEEAQAIQIQEINFGKETQVFRDGLSMFRERNVALRTEIDVVLTKLPSVAYADVSPKLEKFKTLVQKYKDDFAKTEKSMEVWDLNRPVPMPESVSSFVFGKRWLTASFWQDWYGIIPLLVGSVVISIVALTVAVPMAIGAAVYVNQVATPKEQDFIKPAIEFISAIPSVVLGFFGIAILGEFIRWLSGVEALSWIPGFPIAERLNIMTAALLLAFMAIPTIFTLAEDALNNVPRAYVEASLALGATRFQTIYKIMVPASLSGVISAILLGFGRVVGETMVVLLCSGGRIQIPDFTAGFAAIFMPVHTMTGIIAQEMGEVVRESIHYRALFMVGIVLFFISLLINYLAQLVVKRFKISIG